MSETSTNEADFLISIFAAPLLAVQQRIGGLISTKSANTSRFCDVEYSAANCVAMLRRSVSATIEDERTTSITCFGESWLAAGTPAAC